MTDLALRAADADTLRGWVMAPRSDTGVHLATDDGSWEFAQYSVLADHARRIARLLTDHGVGTGSTVGVLMPTSHLCLAALFGVLAAGATLTPITPPQFEPPERYGTRLRGILAAAGADALVSSAAFADIVTQALAPMPAPPTLHLLADAPDNAPLDNLVEPGLFALLQMTSGSTGFPRAVQVSWRNLVANLDVIHQMCDTRPEESGASWLPLYHDMGLISGIFLSVPGQHDMRLMRPDQFVRDPLRWLHAAARAQHTMSPSFGLDYVSRRLTPEQLGDIDLSGLRSLVIGADRINPAHLSAFAELTGGHGFSPSAFVPCYGLAEMTLIATGQRPGEPIQMTQVDRASLQTGRPVRVLRRSQDWRSTNLPADWIVAVGRPAPGHSVRIVDESGQPVPEATLGEIVLNGPSVTHGYRNGGAGDTRFTGGDLFTADSGFLIDGELHVLGRLGTSLKVNGRSVFAEDLDIAVAQAFGIQPSRVVTVAVNDADPPGVAVFVERRATEDLETGISGCVHALLAQVGDQASMWLITVARGALLRTSSGKPRRAVMWQHWRAGQLSGAELVAQHDGNGGRAEIQRARGMFEQATSMAVVPEAATVHFEGSLAEGFGNEGSDIDLLLLVPGSDQHAVMPTVLFADGRRLEVRSQSHEQVRKRLLKVRKAIDSGTLNGITEDLLNRVQRFLHAVPLRVGPHYGSLLDIVSYRECTDLIARWWLQRAGQCLRYSAALVLLDEPAEALSWAREGLLQAMKAFLAKHGEGYLEVKWLPQQIARLRSRADRTVNDVLDEYQSLDDASSATNGDHELIHRMLNLAARLGAPTVGVEAGNLIIKRKNGITTWAIGSTVHVLRNKADVFVLSPQCARSWRLVVFGQTLAATQADRRCVRLFARYGLITLAWRGAGVLKPAAAMCEPDRPLTPMPSARRPVVTIDGALNDGAIARSPLGAKAFAECGGALMLANMILENAREDFAGALADQQWGVATLCARRMVVMAVRILASAWGITPLPADAVLLDVLGQLVPEHDELVETARRLVELSVHDRADALRIQSELDPLVMRVRQVSGGSAFPSSFTSRGQWQQTISRGYQWLRIGGYLGAYVELDEVRDLLTSGGAQPGRRASSPAPLGEEG